MKKRYFLFGLIALELATIPAAAQMIDKVVFYAPQKAINVLISDKPGLKRYAVTSNAPFTVKTENAIGEFDVIIRKSGEINGRRFGDNAQLPGPASGCSAAISPAPTTIYHAHQKTAAARGEILSQAVIVEIHFDPALSPAFEILTEDASKAIARGQSCEPSPA